MEKNLSSMSWQEKLSERLKRWQRADNVKFKNEEAEEMYRASCQRFIDCLTMEKIPDRVPVLVRGTFLVASLYRLTPYEAMYDYEKIVDAHIKFHEEYKPDYALTPLSIGSGRVLEALDYKQYRWPGRGVSKEVGYQYVEAEYMRDDEYKDLIDDPTDFWLRKLLPRMFGAFDGLKDIPPFTDLWEIVIVSPHFVPFSNPLVADGLNRLIEAGKLALEWIQKMRLCGMEIVSMGYPPIVGGTTKAPFDILGDTLRGTRKIMIDLYRRPELILKAVERLTPLAINQGVRGVNQSGVPFVFIPLHKGADGFMSDEQFRKFYWPSLLETVYGLVKEGCVPYLFVEGAYNTRLDYLKELPEKSCFCHFDRTDMEKAKKVLKDRVCIGGNIPAGLLLTGTPEEIKSYCKDLIEKVGRDGGFVLTSGTSLDEGKPENIRAMIEAAKEYGRLS
ncbi:MAG: uroporphyrinogen decarboxylase [Desulfobacterota bacterium]|nr:uroporphyrinogen decarboxylase [Thermodesulfobacteriota bacterium]MDW8001261.1 uroporphyrinogen decarboxylase family protein [Deltaproteobacteria bacterium]